MQVVGNGHGHVADNLICSRSLSIYVSSPYQEYPYAPRESWLARREKKHGCSRVIKEGQQEAALKSCVASIQGDFASLGGSKTGLAV